jgi:hypothetical protein
MDDASLREVIRYLNSNFLRLTIELRHVLAANEHGFKLRGEVNGELFIRDSFLGVRRAAGAVFTYGVPRESFPRTTRSKSALLIRDDVLVEIAVRRGKRVAPRARHRLVERRRRHTLPSREPEALESLKAQRSA